MFLLISSSVDRQTVQSSKPNRSFRYQKTNDYKPVPQFFVGTKPNQTKSQKSILQTPIGICYLWIQEEDKASGWIPFWSQCSLPYCDTVGWLAGRGFGQLRLFHCKFCYERLQCFDALGWAAGRASGLEKNWVVTGEVLAWLSVWSEVQIICIWSSRCHCHPIISCSSRNQNGLPFWCRQSWHTQVVLVKQM